MIWHALRLGKGGGQVLPCLLGVIYRLSVKFWRWSETSEIKYNKNKRAIWEL